MTPKWVIQPLTSAEEANGAGWHHYTESGLDNVWLDGGVTHHKTAYPTAVQSLHSIAASLQLQDHRSDLDSRRACRQRTNRFSKPR